MRFKVKSIAEETDYGAWEKQKPKSKKMQSPIVVGGDEEEDMPKIIMVRLTPTAGRGELNVPRSTLGNVEVGDLIEVTFGAKNKAPA